MKLWTIMPVKPLLRAKSRLSGVLSPTEREKLALNMLVRNVELLKSIPSVLGTLVISRDTKLLSIVRDLGGIHTVQESGQPELNSALLRATDLLRSWGAEAVLILPTDIPLVTAEDIEQIVHLGRLRDTVVIAPDSQKNGTNALLVHPPGIIQYSYGEGSYARHITFAELAGLNVQVYESERIAVDVDTPSDLLLYERLAAKYGVPVIDYRIEEPTNTTLALMEDSLN